MSVSLPGPQPAIIAAETARTAPHSWGPGDELAALAIPTWVTAGYKGVQCVDRVAHSFLLSRDTADAYLRAQEYTETIYDD